MTTRAGMLRRMLMHAADKRRSFICVAGGTLYRGRMFGMRVRCDGCMAGAALQASMHTGVKLCGIHSDILPECILHGYIAVTREAVRLCMHGNGECREKQHRTSSYHALPSERCLRNCRPSRALLSRAKRKPDSRDRASRTMNRFSWTRVVRSEEGQASTRKVILCAETDSRIY